VDQFITTLKQKVRACVEAKRCQCTKYNKCASVHCKYLNRS